MMFFLERSESTEARTGRSRGPASSGVATSSRPGGHAAGTGAFTGFPSWDIRDGLLQTDKQRRLVKICTNFFRYAIHTWQYGIAHLEPPLADQAAVVVAEEGEGAGIPTRKYI